jgi:signal transduction histidine kinase
MEKRVRERAAELFKVNERLLVEIALHRSSVEELEESQEELRELARHLQKAKEDERLRISREIHDELGQMLTGLKMDLDFIKNSLPEAQHELYAKVDSDIGMIDGIIGAIKRICDELRPSLLDHFGIEAAIEWQAEEFQKSKNIVCRVESGLGEGEVDVDRSTALFRIFQESLTNVARHAGATAVTAKLQRVNDSLVLEITDNGKGISSDQQVKPRSFGLIGMRERVLQLGGDIEIISAEGKGTTVKATIPVS